LQDADPPFARLEDRREKCAQPRINVQQQQRQRQGMPSGEVVLEGIHQLGNGACEVFL
jgi:hypothetical protein